MAIFHKLILEFCQFNDPHQSLLIDILPKKTYLRRFWLATFDPPPLTMSDYLDNALKAMKIDDDELIVIPDDPRFRVFEENSMSLLGRLLNPEAQSMSRMIEMMPSHWRVYNRVRGIALSKDKFQFVFQREEDLQTVLNDRPWSYNHWVMLLERWTANPPEDFLTKFEVWVRIRNIPCNYCWECPEIYCTISRKYDKCRDQT